MLKQLINNHKPLIPNSLENINHICFIQEETIRTTLAQINQTFPFSSTLLKLKLTKNTKTNKKLKIACVFSGGQAAGGHNVIAGLFDAMIMMNPESKLYGFLNGPNGIVENKFIAITEETLKSYRNTGGFDLIGSGRTKIETDEQFEAALRTVLTLNLDALVIIGGDDSNTNAALLAEYFLSHGSKTSVIGVPKTIDGDLKTEDIAISFGFDSATKTYSEIIGNLSIDALSAKKYTFFIKLMGRTASHIALECALKTSPNLCLIGEEIASQNKNLDTIVEEITGLIIERSKIQKDYGIILIPEGLLEFIPECKILIQELNQLLASNQVNSIAAAMKNLTSASKNCFRTFPKEIQEQLLMDRDSHGNVQVSKIETEKLLIELVKEKLKSKNANIKFSPIPYFCGYEGRACYPSHFDANYCYSLGMTAALLINSELTGYIACVKNLNKPVKEWEITGIPLHTMIHFEERKGVKKPVIQKALVDIHSDSFKEFRRISKEWRLSDHYKNPGPIQFYGPDELINSIPMILSMNF